MAETQLIVPRFFMHVSPNETRSKSEGRPIFDEFEAVELRFPGDRQKATVFPAHEAEPNATREAAATGSGEVVTYAMVYNKQYREFKEGSTQTLSGTPLSELPFLTEARRRELKALSIHTAEQLASLDGTPLKQLGMGGREMKNQATAYLENARGSADVTSLAAENEALRRQLAERDQMLEEAARVAKENKATPVAGKGGRGKKGAGSEPAAETQQATVEQTADRGEGNNEPSAFAEWDDDDIREWLADATKQPVSQTLPRAELIALADAENAKLAKLNGQS